MRKPPFRLIISLALALLTFAVYAQVLRHGFIGYDDNKYVTENPMVKDAPTLTGVIQTFRSTHAANWHPLTWVSHMADVRLFGLDPAGHHLTSLLLHIANTVILFLLLSRMTGSVWRSGLVAGLFAVDPLHIESVSWVAERKDVLSTFFGLLAIWAYARYVEFKVQGSRFKVGAYVCMIVLFALGLMAKPMLVTLPFVLLLLGYWPLNRFRVEAKHLHEDLSHSKTSSANALPVLVEKVPLFALSLASSIITYLVQQHGEAVRSLDKVPFAARASNAVVSYVAYILKMLWPRDLAILYPHPVSRPAWMVVGAALILLALTVLIVRASRSRPYLTVGWLWYLGTLVPVIGIVQVGSQAMADRYTYLPLVGLFVMLAWGMPRRATGRQGDWETGRVQSPESPSPPVPQSPILPFSAAIALLALSICTWVQARYWQDTASVFSRTLAVTRYNAVAHNSLGIDLDSRGETDTAIGHFERALEIKPDYANAHNNLAIALFRKRDYAGAWEHVELCRQYGGTPHPDFVNALIQRMR